MFKKAILKPLPFSIELRVPKKSLLIVLLILFTLVCVSSCV